jgi:hypothetical protein
MAKAFAHTASGATGLTHLTGYQMTETAGAAARVRIREGDVTGKIVADIRLPADAVMGEQFGFGLVSETGVFYLEVVSGTVQVALYG